MLTSNPQPPLKPISYLFPSILKGWRLLNVRDVVGTEKCTPVLQWVLAWMLVIPTTCVLITTTACRCCLIKQYSHSHILCFLQPGHPISMVPFCLTRSSWDSGLVKGGGYYWRLQKVGLTNQIKLPPIRKTETVVSKYWESNKVALEPNKSEMKKTFCICQLGVRCPFLSLQLATYFWQG